MRLINSAQSPFDHNNFFHVFGVNPETYKKINCVKINIDATKYFVILTFDNCMKLVYGQLKISLMNEYIYFVY